jgi:5-methylcytosine-specific restriction endonuclease McrA
MSLHHRLLLIAARTDALCSFDAGAWTGRCLHCRAAVGVTARGEPMGTTSLEHIVPRAWWSRRTARDLLDGLAGPHDPRNLALACARCNQQKGWRADADGPENPRARQVVRDLLARRAARWREA